MVSELLNYLNKKDGNRSSETEPYIGLVHRLDQPVSGLLVFAKTKEAAAFLSKQMDNGKFGKHYYAVVLGKPQKDKGVLEDYLYKDAHSNMTKVVDKTFPEAKNAVLEYSTVKTLWAIENDTEATLLDIKLQTGRHHQIRVQLSNAGMPILGDTKYGSIRSKEFSRDSACRNVALCAYKLSFVHPVTKETMTFERTPEDDIFEAFL